MAVGISECGLLENLLGKKARFGRGKLSTSSFRREFQLNYAVIFLEGQTRYMLP